MKVWLTNFGFYLPGLYDTIDDAVIFAKSRGFEATILNSNGDAVAFWSPIGGTRTI